MTVFSSLVLLQFVAEGATLFSELNRTLVVSVSVNNESEPIQVARAGLDTVRVSWSLNSSVKSGVDTSYKSVQFKLCFGRVSQLDRPWRKTYDLLKKDKTCGFDMGSQRYTGAAGNSSDWKVTNAIPEASYFVRVYVLDAAEEVVAFGQSTDKNKTTNLFMVEPITGRHASLDIAAGVFSAFSVLALVGFFLVERVLMKKRH